MREIKFRAWDKENKRMIVFDPLFIGDKGMYWKGDLLEPMQYIGLKDENGKEIYEKDIINTADGVCLVCWNEKLASFVLAKDGWMYDHYFGEEYEPENCKVIGNPYENPELLKGDNS
jgi:hypothetical protein